ncbi:MAG: hypothetical protein ACRD3S_00485, partial [Terracidiphilus sp.]
RVLSREASETPPTVLPEPAEVIEVLLAVIQHPTDSPQRLALRLRRHQHPLTPGQVQSVFDQYALGKKKRPGARQHAPKRGPSP